MRVAVIGGGVFGCTIAVDLARSNAQVELFETRGDILEGTTARNMARLHSGYHYPRSDTTAVAARDAATVFAARFPEAVKRVQHWYVVAPGSYVSPGEYVAFLDRLNLPYEVAQKGHAPSQVHTAELVVRAYEAFIDVPQLRRLLRRDLATSGVVVHTGHPVDTAEVPGFDVTVWATYGVPWSRPLRFEVCEVALMELGRYAGDSFVVIDGPFVSLDPYHRLFSLYDVSHSVHHVSVGLVPEIPPEYVDLLNRGMSPIHSQLSNVEAMIDSASKFLWGLHPGGQHTAIYHGSLWSLRAVLPDVDATDERPTLVERDGKVIRVLSGKICTAATVGRSIVNDILEFALI